MRLDEALAREEYDMRVRLQRHVIVCGLLVILAALGAKGGAGQEGQPPRRGLPVWEQGDWWIVSADILVNDGKNPEKKDVPLLPATMPSPRSTFTMEFKFQVDEQAKVGDELCDLISIHPHKLPTGVVDETGGEPLWRLFIRTSDGTLAKFEWKLRQGICLVSGKVEHEGSLGYEAHQPVVHYIDERVPRDVPFLLKPLAEMKALTDNMKILKFTDEFTAEPRSQTTEVYEDNVLGKRQKVVVVTICGQGIGFRREVWVPGYPWWVEWTGMDADGLVRPGILRSRLVEFGGKDGSRTVLPEQKTTDEEAE